MPKPTSIRRPIRVIFFDAVGTLIHLPRGVAHHYAQVAERHGLDLDQEKLRAAFAAAWSAMPAPEVTQTPREDDDRSWWRELVFQTLNRCNANLPPSFDRGAYFSEVYAEFIRPGVWAVFPEVEPVLTALAQKYPLGIISNFDGRLRTILRELNLAGFFQELVISSEVGADKPHPWIFSEAARRFGVDSADALHVGDAPEADWDGASAAGFTVFRLDRSRNSLQDILDELEGS